MAVGLYAACNCAWGLPKCIPQKSTEVRRKQYLHLTVQQNTQCCAQNTDVWHNTYYLQVTGGSFHVMVCQTLGSLPAHLLALSAPLSL